MKKIYKYSVNATELPIGSKPLFGGVQNDEFFIWVEVDDTVTEIMLFDCQVYGTGFYIESDSYQHLNSIQIEPHVWHFYWRTF